jgi:hypothetical protein
MKSTWRASLSACLLTMTFSAACGGTNGNEASLEISGLKSSYCKGDSLNVTVRNLGHQAISINVALETFEGGKWVESWASLGTSPPAIPTKIAKTDRVQAGQSRAYSFDLFALPPRAELVGARHRLRADSIIDSKRRSVTSPEFTLCSRK